MRFPRGQLQREKRDPDTETWAVRRKDQETLRRGQGSNRRKSRRYAREENLLETTPPPDMFWEHTWKSPAPPKNNVSTLYKNTSFMVKHDKKAVFFHPPLCTFNHIKLLVSNFPNYTQNVSLASFQFLHVSPLQQSSLPLTPFQVTFHEESFLCKNGPSLRVHMVFCFYNYMHCIF